MFTSILRLARLMCLLFFILFILPNVDPSEPRSMLLVACDCVFVPVQVASSFFGLFPVLRAISMDTSAASCLGDL